MSNQEILNRAVEALNRNLHREKATVDYCGEIPYLTIMGKRFLCVVEPNLTLGAMIDKIPDHYGPVDRDTRILFVTVQRLKCWSLQGCPMSTYLTVPGISIFSTN